MAGAFDISGINYGYNGPAMGMSNGGAPMSIMPPGASNPVGAALQTQAAAGAGATMGTGAGALNFGGGVGFGTGAGGLGGSGFGFNMPTANLAMGGLQTIGNLWNAFEARRLAQQQFNFTKDVTNTNLNNQIKAYNTTLEDRGRSRAFTEGQDTATADAYVARNRLSR